MKRTLALLAGTVMLTSCGLWPSEDTSGPNYVHLSSGVVRGAFADDHLLFAGIPYAAPPVGPLRWQAPQPASSWKGIRDASKFGPRCVQDTKNDPAGGQDTSEDCLTLNVWTPATPADAKRPVLVWIHGGGFANGSGQAYDARRLVGRDIVVVTINYRLGALGFLAHPALATNGNPGNYGFEDQQAALRWVRDNIASFGGDPQKVTIGGDSAGAVSVCDHLVAPGSAGLFRSAILQSGPCQAQVDLAKAERDSLDYAAGVGCSDPAKAADCLRDLPAEKVANPPWYYPFGPAGLTGPVAGTTQLPVHPMTAFAQGKTPGVPVLMGANRDEWGLFAAIIYLAQGQMPDYQKDLETIFGADSGRVAEQYPLSEYPNSALAYTAVMTANFFSCPASRIESDVADAVPVFAYEFNDPDAPAPEPLQRAPFPVGAGHSLELRYLFDTGGAPALTPAQQKLSDQMIDYWSAFVATGVPRAAGAPEWPALRGPDGPWMSLQPPEPRTFASFDEEHKCDFWATIPPPA